jgi:hypothetical protein
LEREEVVMSLSSLNRNKFLRRLNILFFVLLFLAAILLLAAGPAEPTDILRIKEVVHPEEVVDNEGWVMASLAVFGAIVMLAFVPLVMREGRLFGMRKSIFYRFDYREDGKIRPIHSGYLRELGEREIIPSTGLALTNTSIETTSGTGDSEIKIKTSSNIITVPLYTTYKATPELGIYFHPKFMLAMSSVEVSGKGASTSSTKDSSETATQFGFSLGAQWGKLGGFGVIGEYTMIIDGQSQVGFGLLF